MTAERVTVATLTIPQLDPDVDNLTAALAYAECGWYLLPVRRGTKHPGSVVGNNWQSRSSRDPDQIAAWFAGTSHGIALHAGRSGAVIVDMDHPEKTPPDVLKALRESWAPFQSSRANADGRGHYLFAQPPGRMLGNSVGPFRGCGFEVRGNNGVIIAAPSSHEEADEGGRYAWEVTGPVPVLPARIADDLPDATEATESATDAQVAAFLQTHTNAAQPAILHGWRKALQNHFETGSRHDGTVSVTVGAMKEARAGYFPADEAVELLRAMFITAATRPPTGGEHQRTEKTAGAEFDSILAWAVGQANAADLDEVRARTEDKMPNNVECVDHINGEASAAAALAVGPVVGMALTELENGFWQQRESLQHIYTAALSRMASPWATFGYSAARVLTRTPPTFTLPSIVGGPGSLNWFAVLAAFSGGGKGAATAVARVLIPGPIYTVNPGSGEGAVQAYAMRDDKGKLIGPREAVMFDATEIDSVTAVASRSGATLMAVLRQGFSGESLGFAYSDRPKAFTVDAGTYRMTLVIAVQPARAQSLFDGAGGGTPQRFMWFPAEDSRITADTPEWFPGPLTLPNARDWGYPREITIPPEATKLIKAERAKGGRGEQHALDGHALFCREKCAYALALLDGRLEMNSDDWELSGIVAAVSAHTRQQVAEQLAQGLRHQAEEDGALRGVSFEAADAEKIIAKSQRIGRVADRVLEKLGEAGGRMKNRDLTNAIAYRDRSVLSLVLQRLVAEKRIKFLKETAEWVKL